VKRKISAILAADVAGYSRLVAEDEEETLRRLAGYRAVFADSVARCGGRIFNTAGDAVLSEFPSSVEAVRCAVDIQESMRARNLAYPPNRQMAFRIGITVADVVEREGDLLGDGVNVAARLGDLASPGGICVSRGVYEQVVNKLSVKFADLGERQVKNMPPIHAYVISPHPAVTGSDNGAAAAPRRRAMLAALAIAGVVTGALGMLALKLHAGGENLIVAGNASPQLSEQQAGHKPGFDDARLRALAGSQNIPLPPSIRIITPAGAVPPLRASYLGAWGGDQTWNGVGRHSILVVESIDPSGTALGVLAFGPPLDPSAPDQRPARYRSVAGSITDDGFAFDIGNIKYTFKSTADGLMWGHLQGPNGRGTAEMSITFERIE
jgi:class 3 adenylate cyclase